MSDATVAIVVVCRAEPQDRLRRLFGACAAQTVRCPVYVAAPPADAASIAAAAEEIDVHVRFVSNPSGGRSAGLNRAAAASTEEILCRLDARTQPPLDYVERCVSGLHDAGVGVVGGVQQPVAGDRSVRARAIARALANPYAVGAAPYRTGRRSGPVDTVYLGAFRRRELLELSGYDESLDANEDFDLAARYRATGALVWLDADMVHRYEARATLAEVFQQYRAFGRSKATYWRHTTERPQPRQVVGILGVTAGVVAFVASRHRRPLAAAGAVVLGAIDHVAEPNEGSIAVRGLAVLVEGLLPLAWTAGVLEEAIRVRTASVC